MCLTALFTVKLLYFTWFGALSCLLPFLSLHMRALGVGTRESAIISGILPLLQLLTCPFACILPKITSCYKKTTLWMLLFTAISALLVLLAPAIPQPTKKFISMHFQCGPIITPGIIVDKCNHQCEDRSFLSNGIDAFFTECHVDCSDKRVTTKNTADLCFSDQHSRVCHVVEVNNTLSENFTFGMYLGKVVSHGANECLYPMDGVAWHQSYFHHISCPIIRHGENNTNCALKCDMKEVIKESANYSLSGKQRCLSEGPKAIRFALLSYFGLRSLFHLCLGVSSVLVDQALLSVVKVQRKKHNHYAVWSLLASGVLTPIAGSFVDHPLISNVIPNYNTVFFVFSSLVIVSIILLASLELEGTPLPPVKDTIQLISQLLIQLEIIALLIVVFLTGVVTGFFDTFLFWFLEDLACPYYVMGLTASVGLIIGLPAVLIRQSEFVKRFQPGNLMTICLACQCLRCIGYYFANSFWWTLILELVGSFSFHILWIAVAYYSTHLVPRTLYTSLQSCTGAVHYGLGKGSGAFLGGAIMSVYGFRTTFLVLATFAGASGCFYIMIYHAILKRTSRTGSPSTEVRNTEASQSEENSSPLLTLPSSSNSTPHERVQNVNENTCNHTTRDETIICLRPDHTPL